QGNYEFDISIGSKSELVVIIGRKIGARSLLTLRGGIAFSNVDITANNNLNTNIQYSLSKKWDGFSVGMGYVYGINDKLSIKSKYNLTTFKNKEYPETNSKFVDNRFSLSLIYRIWSR
ncbi:MAG: outer membrane beta-barrel protein, partial [Flavobacteriaceae bacterium]